jgi:hypothetical protein
VHLAAGLRFRSDVCKTEIVVVKASPLDVDLWCGGKAMVAFDASESRSGAPSQGQDLGSIVGKRYVDEKSGLEVLCTKSGEGTLSISGDPLVVKSPKPLPSSD